MRAKSFRYRGYDIDERHGVLRCRYELDGTGFEERIDVGPDRDWSELALEAARIVTLLAGVSYYKAGAPPEVDLGSMSMRPGDRDFLKTFYVDGLAEYAYRNTLQLDEVRFTGGEDEAAIDWAPADLTRPLIPFGGGLDSIVTVELLKPVVPDAALFILNRFDAIEPAARQTGLPIVRARRTLDPAIVKSAERGWLNGHVPATGILSAIAVLAAALDGRHAVVMSNEWSASSPNLVHHGRAINHQWSKSLAFEDGLRALLGNGAEYFSLLRPHSELWIAARFAELREYHGVFHSCNRAFRVDPAQREEQWCGRCDKCCFIDLILSPFLGPDELAAIFAGREPLQDETLLDEFVTLLEIGEKPKPFECVGDARECRAALALSAARQDRRDHAMVQRLAALAPAPDEDLMRPMGPHHIPDAFLAAAPLG